MSDLGDLTMELMLQRCAVHRIDTAPYAHFFSFSYSSLLHPCLNCMPLSHPMRVPSFLHTRISRLFPSLSSISSRPVSYLWMYPRSSNVAVVQPQNRSIYTLYSSRLNLTFNLLYQQASYSTFDDRTPDFDLGVNSSDLELR